MANVKQSLAKLMELDGCIGTCLVDTNTGMMIGAEGGNSTFNLELAAAGNTDVIRAKRKTMKALDLRDSIDEILVSLGKQIHLIRPLAKNDSIFIYVVLDKARGNLGMARLVLQSVEKSLVLE
jgi:hypothetical protein